MELKKIVLKFTCHNNVSNQSVASTPAIFKSVLRSTASFGDVIIFWVLCRLALFRSIFLERSTFSALRVEIVRGLALGALMNRGELSGEIAE